MSEMSQTGAVILHHASERVARKCAVLEDGNLVVGARSNVFPFLLNSFSEEEIGGAVAWDVEKGKVRWSTIGESWESRFFYCIALLGSDLLVTLDSGLHWRNSSHQSCGRLSTWKASTGECIERSEFLVARALSTNCSPLQLDETTFVVTQDKSLSFFNHDHGCRVKSAYEIGNAHESRIEAIASVNNRLVSVSSDGTVKFWFRTEHGCALSWQFNGIWASNTVKNAMVCACISETSVVVATSAGTFRWKTGSPKEAKFAFGATKRPTEYITNATAGLFVGGGTHFLASESDLRLIELSSGSVIDSMQFPENIKGGVRSMVLIDSGRILLYGFDNSVVSLPLDESFASTVADCQKKSKAAANPNEHQISECPRRSISEMNESDETENGAPLPGDLPDFAALKLRGVSAEVVELLTYVELAVLLSAYLIAFEPTQAEYFMRLRERVLEAFSAEGIFAGHFVAGDRSVVDNGHFCESIGNHLEEGSVAKTTTKKLLCRFMEDALES